MNNIDHWQDTYLGELDTPFPATPADLYLQLYPDNKGPKATEAQEAILATNGITALLYATCVTQKSFPAGEAAMEKIGLRLPCLHYFFVPCKDHNGNGVLHIKNTLTTLMAIGRNGWLAKNMHRITRVSDSTGYSSLPGLGCTVVIEYHEGNNLNVGYYASIVRPVDHVHLEYTVLPTL